MNQAKIHAALVAADTFLAALCIGRVPLCFTPKDEHAALGINAAARVLPLFRSVIRWAPGSKLDELHKLVRGACEEIEKARKDVPS